MTAPVAFPVGALVRVMRQPSNQIVQLVGEVGYIEQVQDGDFRGVHTLKGNGDLGGFGSVPTWCLADASSDADLVRRRALHDEKRAKMMADHDKWQARLEAHVADLAAKYKVSPADIHAIYAEVSLFYP